MDRYEYYRRKARRRVRAKKGFYYHFGVYLIMGMFFFSMNMATDGLRDIWFIFPLIPWGTAVLIHYLCVFGFPHSGILSKDWEEKQFQKELDQLTLRDELESELDGEKLALTPGKYSDPHTFEQLKKMYQERWNSQEFV